MPSKGDIERRMELYVAKKDGMLDTNENLATKYKVSKRTIERDLKFLRENDVKWIEKVVNEDLVSLYKETFDGYQTDILLITEILNSGAKPRDKEVDANLIKLRSEMRKDRLGLLMQGPAVWWLQKLQKSREIINATKDPPKAIFGEEQSNTHIDIESTPMLEYMPPVIEKSSEEV